MSILNNTTELQALLNKVNALPEQNGGVELPPLTNEGKASDLLSGKQLINSNGNVVTGTIPTQSAKTITPTESSQTAVASGRYTTGAVTVGAIPDGYLVSDELDEQDDLLTELETVLAGKTSGGSGGSIETCLVSMPQNWNVLGGYAPDLRIHWQRCEDTMPAVKSSEFEWNGVDGMEFEAIKNSILVVMDYNGYISDLEILDNASLITNHNGVFLINILGNCTLNFY